MSAFLMNDDRIAQLADYITTLGNVGYDYFGYSMPELLRLALIDCMDRRGNLFVEKVFEKLYNFNAAAVSGRYKTEQEPTPSLPLYVPLIQHRSPKCYDEIKPWHYELFKLTQCFLYQCDEDATSDTGLFKALKELESLQALHIVQNNPLWQQAAWG